MVDGKEVDHFELSIDIKQAITDGVIEAGNDLCVNYTAVLNDKADFYIIGGLLVVGAGVLLVTKKRMGKAEN